MEYAIVSAKSQKEIQKLMDSAKELGLNVQFAGKELFEDLAIAKAIENGETRKIINTAGFLKSLSKS